MPDGTPGQQAQDDMAQWLEDYRPVPKASGPFGVFGQIGSTVENLVAAAGTGQIAVAPDAGQAIINQLTKVQEEVNKMVFVARQAAADPRFGGGYAEQVGRFIQQAAAGAPGSAEEILAKYRDELEQLKQAVAKSMENYHAADARSARNITSAGGEL